MSIIISYISYQNVRLKQYDGMNEGHTEQIGLP